VTDAAKPQFQHDCPRCTFLGAFNHHDLYHCTQGGGHPTVIARYGDDGWDYLSGLPFTARSVELMEAERRARERGLLL
jgi:hypothetical protein